LPSLEKLHREFKDHGLIFAAVNLQEPKQVVKKWIQDRGLTFPVLFDHDGKVGIAYRVHGTPSVFLVDRHGRLVGQAAGPRGWTSDKGRGLFKALLANAE
jgi:peroxiredoxin